MKSVLELQTGKNYSIPKAKNWYIFYTAPRAEKSVLKDLMYKNYDAFLPTMKVHKQWKNRQKKIIEEVLFPGYIFVNTIEHELYRIIQTPKIVACIKCSGKPSIIPLKDIETIKKMISFDYPLTLETVFLKGERVRIICGPLEGHEGTLISQKGKTRFGIQLKEINHTVMIDISAQYLKKIGS
jgi:transcription antitermination factor NusG